MQLDTPESAIRITFFSIVGSGNCYPHRLGQDCVPTRMKSIRSEAAAGLGARQLAESALGMYAYSFVSGLE